MKQITMEVQRAKDIQLLLQLAERLHIKAKIENKKTKELAEKELSIAGMKLAEKSFAKDWENEDDARVAWEKAFRKQVSLKDDKLLEGNMPTEFDIYEWEW